VPHTNSADSVSANSDKELGTPPGAMPVPRENYFQGMSPAWASQKIEQALPRFAADPRRRMCEPPVSAARKRAGKGKADLTRSTPVRR